MVFENLLALHIAILKECSPELAFEWLDRYQEKKLIKKAPYYPWTIEDLMDISKYRQQGINWNEIGSYYGVNKQTVFKAYKRYKGMIF